MAFDLRFHRAIYLTGPTASGKTAVGVCLARLLDAEVVSLDSMTLYRGMDIGTAKPTMEERGEVPHHLIDVLDPWQPSNVASYRAAAVEAVDRIEASGRRVLFVGGTPMYLKVLLRGLFEGPPADLELRRRLEDEAERLGNLVLHQRLSRADSATAARLHPNDRRRVVRALEVFEGTGRRPSELLSEHERPAPSSVPVFALERPREVLRVRIRERIDGMMRKGWIEEVQRLIALPRPLDPVPAQAVGYRELIDYLDDPNRTALQRVVDNIKARTLGFAKRQATWFRGLSEVRALEVDDEESARVTAESIAARL